MIRFVIAIFIFSVLTSCSFSHKIANKKLEKSKVILATIAHKKYKDNYRILYNKKGDFVIVTKREKEVVKLIPDLNYFVYSMKSKSIVIEDHLVAGNVYWENNYLLKAIEREQKAESAENSYSFDVKNKIYMLN